MTAVISYFQRGNPVLVGDLLLSGNEPDTPACLPTTGSVENVFPQGSGFVPVGLVQKIDLITNYFAVAWSGSQIEARTVISEIRDQSGRWSWNPDDVETSIVRIVEASGAGNLSLLWLLFDGKQVFQNGFEAIGRSTEKKGFGRILGIGSKSALEHFDNLMDFVCATLTTNETNHPALVSGLVTAAAFSSRELANPNVLTQYFGGGFEVLVLADNRFQKLDDFVLVTWDAEEDGQGGYKLSVPYYFQRHLYCGDILVIRAAKLEATAANSAKYAPMTFYAPPAARGVSREELESLPRIEISASLICNIIQLKTRSGRVELLLRANRWATQEPQMTISEHDGEIRVEARADYLATLINSPS